MFEIARTSRAISSVNRHLHGELAGPWWLMCGQDRRRSYFDRFDLRRCASGGSFVCDLDAVLEGGTPWSSTPEARRRPGSEKMSIDSPYSISGVWAPPFGVAAEG
jgi:hypothetical protein